MKIAVGFDRGADSLRRPVTTMLVAQSHEVLDVGPGANGRLDTALTIAAVVASGRVDRAILVSSSALGSSFAANKIDGVHAGVCTDTYDARRGGENGMNLMCLGTDLTPSEIEAIVAAFLGAKVRLPLGITVSRAVVAA